MTAVGLRAVRRRCAGRYADTREDRGVWVRVTVVVAHKSHRHRKMGRRARKLLYTTWRVGGTPVSVRDVYRTRFGVESSYRQLGQVRPRTSATSGAIRLLWVVVGLILRNAWVRFGAGSGRRWPLASACLVLLAEVLAAGPDERSTAVPTHRHASPST